MDDNIFKSENLGGIVDLIVLSYNQVDISKSFLEYFKKHTDNNFCKIIWIDNGSTDGSRDFLKSYFQSNLSNYVLVLNEDNKGVIGGRNQGYEISCDLDCDPSEYIMFLDNDQFVYDDWLEHHISVLKSGEYDMIGVEAWKLNPSFMPMKQIDNLKEYFNYVGCGGSLIERKAVEDVGLFDEGFNPAYFEDPDLTFRMLEKGYKIGWNKAAKIIHMPHQTLGNLDAQEKHKRLINSLNYFRSKWKGHKMKNLYQKDLSEFN